MRGIQPRDWQRCFLVYLTVFVNKYVGSRLSKRQYWRAHLQRAIIRLQNTPTVSKVNLLW